MTGLIGHWPLHEWSGRANDLSGNGNHGAVEGGVAQGVAGVGGLTAYSFDGSSGRVDYGSNPVGGEQAITVSLWVRFDSLNLQQGASDLLFGGRPNNDDVIEISQNQGGWQFTMEHDTTRALLQAGSVDTGKWYHVAMVFDAPELEGFVDGTSAGTETGPGSVSDSVGTLYSAYHPTQSVYADCAIADVRLYTRALSAAEVATLHEWGSVGATDPRLHDGSDPGAVTRWAMDGDVTDSWGSYDGTDNTSDGYLSDAIRGQAKVFDGGNDYIEVPTLNDGSALSEYTFSAWAKPVADSSYDYLLYFRSSDGTFGVRNDDNNVWEHFHSGSGNTFDLILSESSRADDWQHVAQTWDGGTVTVYYNGTPVGTLEVGSIYTDSTGNAIGSHADGTQQHWDNAVDDVRIYDRALSPVEVRRLYLWGTRGRDMAARAVVR